MTLFRLAVFATLALLPAVPQEPQRQPAAAEKKADRADLEQLVWISGTWVVQNGGRTTEEHWRPLQGTTLLGSSHTYDDAKTHFIEHLRITLMRDKIAYVAMPGGAKATVTERFGQHKLERRAADLRELINDLGTMPAGKRIDAATVQQVTDALDAIDYELRLAAHQSFVDRKRHQRRISRDLNALVDALSIPSTDAADPTPPRAIPPAT